MDGNRKVHAECQRRLRTSQTCMFADLNEVENDNLRDSFHHRCFIMREQLMSEVKRGGHTSKAMQVISYMVSTLRNANAS